MTHKPDRTKAEIARREALFWVAACLVAGAWLFLAWAGVV